MIDIIYSDQTIYISIHGLINESRSSRAGKQAKIDNWHFRNLVI